MKQIFLPVLAVLALASCSKNETGSVPGTGEVEIKAASQGLSIDTRAPFEGNIGADNSLTAYVIMSQTANDYSTLYGTAGTMTFAAAGTAVGFDGGTSQYYPDDDSQIYLSALYPATGWSATPTTTSEFTFDGSQDVMAAAQQSSKKSTAGTVPSFTFNHLLTKLTIKIKAEDGEAATAWGEVTGIRLSKANEGAVYSKATVTLQDGMATFSDAVAEGISFYGITDETTFTDNEVSPTASYTLTTDPKLVAYALVAPVDADGIADYELKVTARKPDGSSVEALASVSLQATAGGLFTGSTQGQAFEITMNFKGSNPSGAGTTIQASATVTEWANGGSAEVDVE